MRGSTNRKCSYVSEEGEECPHDFFANAVDPTDNEMRGWCIFHYPIGRHAKSKRKVELFWNAFNSLFEDTADKYNEGSPEERSRIILDCTGFIFPESVFPILYRTYSFKVSFKHSVFKGPVSFEGAGFLEKVDFDSAVFETVADFKGVVFEGGASFRSIKTSAEITFKSATFEAKADFTDARFGGEAEFFNANFMSDAFFIDVEFETRADFQETEFHGRGEFTYAVFNEYAYFRNAVFYGNTSFRQADFRHVAYFHDTIFEDYVSFGSAVFHKPTYFTLTEFRSGSSFKGAKFRGIGVFGGSVFRGQVNLSGISVSKRVVFDSVLFDCGAEFWGIETTGYESEADTGIHGEVFLNRTYFQRPHEVTLGGYGSNLNHWSFANTNIEDTNIAFEAWETKKRFWIARFLLPELDMKYIYDFKLATRRDKDLSINTDNELGTLENDADTFEGEPETNQDLLDGSKNGENEVEGIARLMEVYSKVDEQLGELLIYLLPKFESGPDAPTITWNDAERVYRGLRLYYERLLAYDFASGFHYGQMECRRKNREKSWSERFVTFLYKTISGYGESYSLPLFWLLVGTLVFFPLAFLSAGIPDVGNETVKWYLDLFGGELSFTAYSQALRFSMKTALSLEGIRDSTMWFSIMAGVERLYVVVIATFFVLALRRRFKR